jgi:hypothetical protein
MSDGGIETPTHVATMALMKPVAGTGSPRRTAASCAAVAGARSSNQPYQVGQIQPLAGLPMFAEGVKLHFHALTAHFDN